jgi:glycosyltransferase involved in cell wall biosynthesis
MKRALIVFPDEWLAYSSTVLNMVKCLETSHDVTVMAFDNGRFETTVGIHELTFIRVSRFWGKIMEGMGAYLSCLSFRYIDRLSIYRLYKLIALIVVLARLKSNRPAYDLIVGVDSVGYLATRIIWSHSVFLSLEIRKDIFLLASRLVGINHLVIQSQERSAYIIGNTGVKVSYVQNSHIMDHNQERESTESKQRNLVYLGNIMPNHGVEQCADAIQLLDDQYSLTLKGFVDNHYNKYLRYLRTKYQSLLKSGRLTIDTSYIEQSELLVFLRRYYIGFCIYDFSHIASGDFNYISSPAGKLFNYYAAGIPIVGMDIIGLRSVKEFKAGVLLTRLNPSAIVEAVLEIEQRYDWYTANSMRAALAFDFKLAFDTFIRSIDDSKSYCGMDRGLSP